MEGVFVVAVFCAGFGFGAGLVSFINARWWGQEAERRRRVPVAIAHRRYRDAPPGTSVERRAEMWRTGQLDA